ncbi:PIN domain-containing protein [Paenibacillus soyae]|uniref:PIN domain-containing protein n=1 Tax=Paenibacillus soyae TaxID=2969249 RepID=A0A9X2MRD2_9BACL|nr:PIN domain-containing protein [Paenibacillus soyae]MCR2805481.1 PIN domain-containing protein [Paenibacillus soyae]
MRQTLLSDTNIILRLLLNDDAEQTEAIVKLFEEEKITLVVTAPVVAEACWTLKAYYKFSRQEIASALLDLLDHEDISVEQALIAAIEVHGAKNVDLVDAYLSEKAKMDKQPVLTWDKDFKKLGCEYYKPNELL